ncbi:hypothetical protein D9M68_581300 [compost metagenome]
MRQNTWRTARGMFLAGSLDSPAAMPISSVPWKEKPTTIATPINAAKPPANGASPTVQLARPPVSPPRMMPSSIITPMATKPRTATTLISANQNSASPKPRADIAFSPKVSARNKALQ